MVLVGVQVEVLLVAALVLVVLAQRTKDTLVEVEELVLTLLPAAVVHHKLVRLTLAAMVLLLLLLPVQFLGLAVVVLWELHGMDPVLELVEMVEEMAVTTAPLELLEQLTKVAEAAGAH
jgi:hypothetical protein